jgi:hypothetical protein
MCGTSVSIVRQAAVSYHFRPVAKTRAWLMHFGLVTSCSLLETARYQLVRRVCAAWLAAHEAVPLVAPLISTAPV